MTEELRGHLHEIATAAANAADAGDVGGTRNRVSRRRRRRLAALAGAGVLILGIGIAVPWTLLGQSAPPVAGESWEACGQDVETAAAAAFEGAQVYTDDGPVRLRIDPSGGFTTEASYVAAEVTYAASGVERFAVVNVDDAPLATWVVDGDGQVVGAGRASGGYPDDLAVTPGDPTWIDAGFELVSCGEGSAASRGDALPAGEFDLVVAVGVAPASSGSADEATAVVLGPTRMTLRDQEEPVLDMQCGAPWSHDAAMSTDGHDLGIRLDGPGDIGEVRPQDPDDGDPPGARFVVTATNTADADIAGSTGHPWVIVVRDGVVVGHTGGMDDIGLPATMAAGASIEYEAWVPLDDCATLGVGDHADTSGGEPLPSGTYELYAVMDFFLTDPAGSDGPEQDRTDVTVVGGPWTVTVP